MLRDLVHSYFHRKMCPNTLQVYDTWVPFGSKQAIPDKAIMLPGQSSSCSQHHLMTGALELTEKADKMNGDRCPWILASGKATAVDSDTHSISCECLQQKRLMVLPAVFLIMFLKGLFLLFLE